MAYIQFEKEEYAKQAIEQANGDELKGEKIEVNKHEKKGTREASGPEVQ